MPTIYVSRNGNSNNLKLRDSQNHNPGNDQLTTNVLPDDTVTWELDPQGSNLDSLVSVTKTTSGDPSFDSKSIDLLQGNPTINNGVLTGKVIKLSPGKGKYESYKIGFKITSSGPILYDDPKLQMDA